MKTYKKVIYATLGLGLIFLLGVSIYATKVIVSIPLVKMEEASKRVNLLSEHIDNKLEKSSLVNVRDLQAFLHFSIEPQMDLPIGEEQNGLAEIIRDTEIPLLLKNDCKDLYCYQHRINFSKIPSSAWKSLIGVEDNRFIEHSGVDPKAVARAIVADLKEMRFVQGGSTLTQQLVKNLYFSNEKSIERKLKEMIFSLYLEFHLEKEDILELYLNEVYWGSMQGIKVKGLYAASIFYFSKPPSELSFYESMILICMLKGPHFYSPIKDNDRLMSRVNVVRDRMIKVGIILDEEVPKWSSEEWKLWQESLMEKNRGHRLNDIWKTTKMNASFLNHYEKYVFQRASSDILKSEKIKKLKLDMALKAVILNSKSEKESFEFYSKYERDLYRAIYKEKHQVGSVLKPLIYYILTKFGVSFDEVIKTDPITLELISGEWTPKEPYRKLPEEVTLNQALQMSLNRPIIKKVVEVGFDKVEKKLLEYIPQLQLPLKEYPSQLLGAVELTPSELSQIYAKFISDVCRENASEVLDVLKRPGETTIKNTVDSFLVEMEFFGKTGTSNRGRDNWYVFFEGLNLGVIWLGLEGQRDVDSLGLSGSSTAFKVFQSFMRDRGKRFNEFGCELLPNTSQEN